MAFLRVRRVDFVIVQIASEPAEHGVRLPALRPVRFGVFQPSRDLAVRPARRVGEQEFRDAYIVRDEKLLRRTQDFRQPAPGRGEPFGADERVQPRRLHQRAQHVRDGPVPRVRGQPRERSRHYRPHRPVPAGVGFLLGRRERVEPVVVGCLRRPAARCGPVLLVPGQGEDAAPGMRQRRARAIDEMDPLRRVLARNDHGSPAVLETAVAHEPVTAVAGRSRRCADRGPACPRRPPRRPSQSGARLPPPAQAPRSSRTRLPHPVSRRDREPPPHRRRVRGCRTGKSTIMRIGRTARDGAAGRNG